MTQTMGLSGDQQDLGAEVCQGFIFSPLSRGLIQFIHMIQRLSDDSHLVELCLPVHFPFEIYFLMGSLKKKNSSNSSDEHLASFAHLRVSAAC